MPRGISQGGLIVRRTRFLSSILATLALLAAAPVAAAADPAVVRTADGPVRGTVTDTNRTFQGIPFAAPPTGENRWRAPQHVTPWESTKDATRPGSVCPQRPITDPNGPQDGAEDCLFLNVSTPRTSGTKPVMVWIHGGGYTTGAGSDYPVTQLAERGDVVVVTLNYRLGALGFLSLPGLDGGGDFGLADQQAALKWVQHNARAFGGDPHNVTIFGESAGGLSVCAQLTSPRARGLFHKAIIQSGPCEITWGDGQQMPGQPAGGYSISRTDADKTGSGVAAKLGCADIGCLRATPVAKLLDFPLGQPAFGTPLLPEDPAQAVGHRASVPTMIGMNRDENRLGALLFPEPLTPETYVAAVRGAYGAAADRVLAKYPVTAYPSPTIAWTAISTDVIWARSTHRITGQLASRVPTFGYEFRDRTVPSMIPGTSGLGAYHTAELPYLFPGAQQFHGAQPITLNADQQALGLQLQRYWATFAHTGRPNGPGLPAWRPNLPSDNTVQGLDIAPAGIGRIDQVTDHNLDFWSEILDH
ncbi:carboxylesterase family protein [Pseudonocardiaceae bacterium YIM PH 21723]|nr:carboxylesterase family protein [Pseudonocardiaceae bacterium YIM PH 21723]